MMLSVALIFLLIWFIQILGDPSHPRFKDITGMCLDFHCGLADTTFSKKTPTASIQKCRRCKPDMFDLPQAIATFCLPNTHIGGKIFVLPGWTTLATLSISSGGAGQLRKGEATIFGRSNQWIVHEEVPNVPEAIGLSSCISTKSNLVEVKFISFVGTPGKLMRRKPVHVMMEAVMNLENYVEDKFKHEIKKWFGIRMVQVPMNTNEGYILTKSSKIKISEAYKFIPSQVFETRITCNQKSCDLTSWFGCFYVACREIPGAELAAENAFYLAKEATRKNMEAAKQELIAEQEKEEKKEMLALEQQAGAEAEQGQTHAQWMREQPLYYPVYFAVPRDAGSGKIYQWYNPIYSSLGIQQPIQSHVQQSPYYIS